MAQRPFRFGVQVSKTPDRRSWIKLAKQAEDAGISVLTLPDHFSDQLAPVPALMAAADATKSLRVGALVWDNDYKHPAVLAKELATIDLLSDGRLEVGLGAGWEKVDYDRTGIRYDPPGVRIDRFEEAVTIIKGFFGDGPVNFTGRHYEITDYDALPKPIQKPPPLLIGGGGRRILTIAAREADIVGVNGDLRAGRVTADVVRSMSADSIDEKIAVVNQAAAGRAIELNVRSFLVKVTNERNTAADQIASMLGFTRADVLETPFALLGTPDQIVDDLRRRRERWGFSYVIIGQEDLDSFAPVIAALAGT